MPRLEHTFLDVKNGFGRKRLKKPKRGKFKRGKTKMWKKQDMIKKASIKNITLIKI